MDRIYAPYAGKTFEVANNYWCDESGGNEDIVIRTGATLKAIGYLRDREPVIVWTLLKYQLAAGANPPLVIYDLNKLRPISFFNGLSIDDYSTNTPVFCCRVYPDMHLKEVGGFGVQPAAPRTISEYPHTCPNCQKPALILFRTITCSRGCNPVRK